MADELDGSPDDRRLDWIDLSKAASMAIPSFGPTHRTRAHVRDKGSARRVGRGVARINHAACARADE